MIREPWAKHRSTLILRILTLSYRLPVRHDDHNTMNFSETIATFNKASAFDLYRLRAAIDRVLDEPGWMDAVRSRLRIGQAIEYFDPQANRPHSGQILELRRKQAVVLDLATQKRWLISYAAVNLDGADVEIREKPKQGLGRNEVAVGDIVGFLDRDHQQRSGRIVQLNDKTITLRCGQQQWRVSYGLLHRVVDSSAFSGETLELESWTPNRDSTTVWFSAIAAVNHRQVWRPVWIRYQL